MSLSKLIEEIKQVKQYAEEDVESGSVETLSGRRGRKNQAIERLKMLKDSYRKELMESTAFIVVTGEKKDAFTSSAVENFKCFPANPETIYEDLSNRVSPAMYQGKMSVSNLFDILGRHLEDKASELGIVGYPQMIFKHEYSITIRDRTDLVGLVKRAINEQVGSEIVGLQAVQSLLNDAIKQEHSAKVTPVVLSTGDESLALSLASNLGRLHPKGVFLVVAGKGTKILKSFAGAFIVKDATTEAVGATLGSISSMVKK